jgi:hypothetical protein
MSKTLDDLQDELLALIAAERKADAALTALWDRLERIGTASKYQRTFRRDLEDRIEAGILNLRNMHQEKMSLIARIRSESESA